MIILYLYLILINAIAWALMLIDKRKAQKKMWRIPEATLMTVAAVGGSIGMLLGMNMFRHKTKHIKFTLGVPAILIAQIALVIFLYQIL